MKRKTVSLCLIARDEEASIGRTIKSVLALVDEIVVVDTGSSDNTRIIAEGYGARVVDHRWRDDFAAARNAGLAAATGDWLLVLDCDEHLQSIRPLEFQRLLGDPAAIGYRVKLAGRHVVDCPADPASLRLFRSHPDVRFQYPVYEQIAPSVIRQAQTTGQLVLDSPLVVVQDAGSAEQASRKRERNLRLLRQALLARPDEPYFAFLLGSETLQRLDEDVLPVAGLQAGLLQLETAWRRIAELPPDRRHDTAYGPHLASDFAAALRAAGRPQAAADVAAAGRRIWGDSARLCLQTVRSRLAAHVDLDDPARRETSAAGIREDLEALGELLNREPAEHRRRLQGQLLHCRGELALVEGSIAAAAEAFEQALNHHQDHAASWVGLAECARLAGDRKRALRLYLRAVTASEWCVHAWDRGCSLMEELGFHDNAQSWRLRVQERFPERPGAGAGSMAAPVSGADQFVRTP